MTRRTICAYAAALSFVNQKLIELDGLGIIIDFENAMRLALKIVCPNLPIYGCLFHYMQALQRKIKSIPSLFQLIRTNPDAKFLFRKFQALALLPANLIKDCFVYLLRETLETFQFKEFAPFLDYFKTQWLKRVKPVHFSVYNLETRTTGAAEAFNCKVNKSFRTHGDFFNFVEALQKEETVKADQFSRDINGILQPDRRKMFFKKRAQLISKYWKQLEKKIITPKHFLSIMANLNNEILCDEKLMFTDEIDLKLSNENILIDGDDIPYIVPDICVEDDEPISTTKRTRRTKKRKSTEMTDSSENNARKKSKRTSVEVRETIIEPVQTRSKTKRTIEMTKRSTTRLLRAHELSNDSDSDMDRNMESRVYDIMDSITQNGSTIVNLRKKFQELEKQENIVIDPGCLKCIICGIRPKNTVLYPCLHQYTCGPCWIIWKIHQINTVPIDSINNDEAIKLKCPVCRQNVDKFEEAIN